jgi:hypothetical protein
MKMFANLGVELTEVVPPLYHLAPSGGDPSMEATGHIFHGCSGFSWTEIMLPGTTHGLEFYGDDGSEQWWRPLETTAPGFTTLSE